MAQCNKHLSSSKKVGNSHKKFKTEAIDEYQALNFHKIENFQKRPNFNLPQQDFKRKHCIMKPMRNKINQLYMKAGEYGVQNCTTEEESIKDQLVQINQQKRSGSAVLSRKNIMIDSNKQNHLNQQDKHQNEFSPKWKNLIKQSVSTIFQNRRNSQKAPIKTSHSLVRVRSKQHLVFCASKLPKDFFGESILGQNYQNGHQQKFIFGSHGHIDHEQSILRKAGFRKIVFGQKVQKLMFSQEKGKSQNETNDPEFTFRKQKSKKCLQSKDEELQQTPRFLHKRQATQNLRINESLPSLHKNIYSNGIFQTKKKIHTNFSKQNLQL